MLKLPLTIPPYPDLPIIAHKAEIIQAITAHPVVIIAGETGSGKTTQLPKFCLEAGLGLQGMIAHTQPRRVAARTISARIAHELHCKLGEQVGYKIRFSDKTSSSTYIKMMTDGILLQELQSDPLLRHYDAIIIDEAHERSLNIDFLLGNLKILSAKRPDLKIIITSATIDLARFSAFFSNAPIIEIPGRSYPVEVHYLTPEAGGNDDPILQVVNAVKLAMTRGMGDILIFQSGEKEIREVIEAFKDSGITNAVFLPLYARQSASEQQRIFETAKSRKIIVSTNVAETSLTVPNIRYVIDSGYARISRYNYRTKLQRLEIEAISRASAEQRKGRCGRVGPGICYRLYSAEDLSLRDEFTTPEILRTHLAGVILKLLALGVQEIQSFPFIDPPDYRHIKDGLMLLHRLGAIDDEHRITPIGRLLAQFPTDPKLARILVAAHPLGALAQLLIIVSFLSIADPRERPHEFQEKADLAHAKFADPDSDFMGILKLWEFISEQWEKLSERKMRKCCKENFLSFIRICEWFDIHEQLTVKVKELGFKINQVAAEYSAIHRSLLYGCLDSIGTKVDKKEYLGARNIKFFIHPSSSLFNKPPTWIMAYEIVYTTKTFARYNAAIDPAWLEQIAGNLLKYHYFEPFFDPKTNSVMAFERVTLFGLEIIPKRRIHYQKISIPKAREIFIMQGLVEGQLTAKCQFYQKNAQVLQQLHDLENRLRRQHVLLFEQAIYDFYAKRLSMQICSLQSLQQWIKTHGDDSLCFTANEISDADKIREVKQQFPDQWLIQEQPFKLEYVFDPESTYDGVTLCVPFATLPAIKETDLSWPVPGMLTEKIEFYLRALPKRLRVLFSPLPEHVQKAQQFMQGKAGSFTQVLAAYLNSQADVGIKAQIWQDVEIPAYLITHIKVIKESGITLRGDSLSTLFETHKAEFPKMTAEELFEDKHFTRWTVDEITPTQQVQKNHFQATYYSALVDHDDSVSIELFETTLEADIAHRQGLARLYLCYLQELVRQFKRQIPSQTKKSLTKWYSDFGDIDQLLDEVCLKAAEQLFVSNQPDVRSRIKFEEILAQKRTQFLTMLNQVYQLALRILEKRSLTVLLIEKQQSQAKFPASVKADLQQQLKQMFNPHFIKDVPLRWLNRFPVYLQAIEMRLQKLFSFAAKDQQAQLDIDFVQKAYLKKLTVLGNRTLSNEDDRIIFRWKVEELRVSLFAQTLGTVEAVSKVRLLKLLEQFDNRT